MQKPLGLIHKKQATNETCQMFLTDPVKMQYTPHKDHSVHPSEGPISKCVTGTELLFIVLILNILIVKMKSS